MAWTNSKIKDEVVVVVVVVGDGGGIGDNYIRLAPQYKDAILTHWGRVTQICVSKLTIIGAIQATSHYLNQC